MNKSAVFIGVIILFLTAGFFYWFSYRPEKIRANCLAESEMNPTTISISNDVDRQTYIEAGYKNCIRSFGLEK